MKKQSKSVVQWICILLGICMLAGAAFVMVSWQGGIRTSERKAQAYTDMLRALLPEMQTAIPEERSDNTMPVLSLDETDFIGILEMPLHGSVLPVCETWGDTGKYPCRFDGSIYNGSLQIGTTSQKGQYDFYRDISVGDPVFFTDMEGNRYSFAVSDLRYEKHADQAALGRKEAALTVFVKNVYAFEYIIISCDVLT